MWINEQTLGEFVLHADIRYELWKAGKEAPGVLTDEYLAANGYPVLTPVQPPYDPMVERLAPRTGSKNGDKWEKHFDVIPLDAATIANNQNIKAVQEQSVVLAQLQQIDIKSIRALREYVAAQSNAPQIIKDHEAKAAEARRKLK